MSYALAFDYDHEVQTLRRIIDTSHKTQWFIGQVDWAKDLPQTAYIRILEWQGALRSDYVRKLSPTKQEQLARQFVAFDFSQILHGEQCAMMLAGQLVSKVDDMDARIYAATQCKDESRHVEAVKRVLHRIGPIYKPADMVGKVIDDLINCPLWPRQVLGLQLFLEARALLTFRQHLLFVDDPVFNEVIHNIERDESQHVAFGMQYLKTGVEGLSTAQRNDLIAFASWLDDHVWNLQRPDEYRAIFEEVGLDYDEFRGTYSRSCFLRPSAAMSAESMKSIEMMHNQFHRWFYGALARIGLPEVIERKIGRKLADGPDSVLTREEVLNASPMLPWLVNATQDAWADQDEPTKGPPSLRSTAKKPARKTKKTAQKRARRTA